MTPNTNNIENVPMHAQALSRINDFTICTSRQHELMSMIASNADETVVVTADYEILPDVALGIMLRGLVRIGLLSPALAAALGFVGSHGSKRRGECRHSCYCVDAGTLGSEISKISSLNYLVMFRSNRDMSRLAASRPRKVVLGELFFPPFFSIPGVRETLKCGELMSNMQGSSRVRGCVTAELQWPIRQSK
jgi:hypothetical protein